MIHLCSLYILCFSFLLDRLLQYEELDPSATDTDVTDSSASEDELPPQPKRYFLFAKIRANSFNGFAVFLFVSYILGNF